MNYASILFVDNDERIIHFFQMILEEMGYDVSTAYTDKEAIDRAMEGNIDLVILDYKLSDMKGDIVAVKLKKIKSQICVVFITGYSEIKEKILRDDLSRFVVVKSIKEEELIETVEPALNERLIALNV